MERIKRHIEKLQKLDSQRKGWLLLSGFISAGVIGIIFGWNFVQSHQLVWLVVSVGLLVSVTWWYWTMKLILHMVEFKMTESEILTEMVDEIKHIKNIVTKKVD